MNALDLRDRLFELVGARPGDSIAGCVLRDASTEVAARLTFEGGGRSIHVEVLLAEGSGSVRPHAARTKRLLFSYRAGDAGPSIPGDMGITLCKGVAAAAAPREDAMLSALAAESRAHEPRLREVRVSRLLEPVGDRLFTLTPYVGCLVGCRYCYAQRPVAEVRRLEQLPEVAWGSYVDARINAPEVLARELEGLPMRPIKLCPIVSDPYQVVESRLEITRRCLEVLRDARAEQPVLVLTRMKLVERDAELLAALPRAYAGISIPTVDDAVAEHFEPRASPPSERLAALARLKAAGVRTFAVVQPILAGDVVALAEVLAASADSVSIGLLEGVEGASREFADPRYSESRDFAWQRARADELARALTERQVPIWPGSPGELPPELT
ncbi:MAG: hypothetical protein U0271_23650 [Polyangiaceae bacterium]